MNLFGWRKNLSISHENPVFKVRYLGNVQTSVMKGEGCADRATNVIWSNHQRNGQQGIEMKIELTGSGMKAYTTDQGLTEYLASRISYCIAHPDFPRLFVWVYRHEGRKAKMELRCHAVLCKSEAKAKSIAFQLCEKLRQALDEFKREKIHLQNSRLARQKTNSVPASGNLLPLRTQLLSTAKNFRAPPTRTNSSCKLGAIMENGDEKLHENIVEEAEDEEEEEVSNTELHGHILASGDLGLQLDSDSMASGDVGDDVIDLEFGNDFHQLKKEVGEFCGDSDEESAESGFHDQDGSSPDSESGEGTGNDSSSEGRGVKDEEERNEEMEKVCVYPSGVNDNNTTVLEATAL